MTGRVSENNPALLFGDWDKLVIVSLLAKNKLPGPIVGYLKTKMCEKSHD